MASIEAFWRHFHAEDEEEGVHEEGDGGIGGIDDDDDDDDDFVEYRETGDMEGDEDDYHDDDDDDVEWREAIPRVSPLVQANALAHINRLRNYRASANNPYIPSNNPFIIRDLASNRTNAYNMHDTNGYDDEDDTWVGDTYQYSIGNYTAAGLSRSGIIDIDNNGDDDDVNYGAFRSNTQPSSTVSATTDVMDVSALKPQVLSEPEQDYREYSRQDEEELRAFQCAICHDVMTDPSGCGSCSGRFCHGCLGEQVRVDPGAADHNCPTCRGSLHSRGVVRDQGLREQMNVAMFPCRHAACSLHIFANNMGHHERYFCQGVRIACKYAPLGCIWKGTRTAYAQEHEDECHIAGNPGLLAYIETNQQQARALQKRLHSMQRVHDMFEGFMAEQMDNISQRVDRYEDISAVQNARLEQYQAEPQCVYSPRNPFHILWLVACSLAVPSYVVERHNKEFATLTRNNGLGRAIAHNCLMLMPTCLLATKLFCRGLAFMLWEFRVHHLPMAYCWISSRNLAANFVESGIWHRLAPVRAVLVNSISGFVTAATASYTTFEAGTCAASYYPTGSYDYPLLTSNWDRLQVLAIPVIGFYTYRGFMRDTSSPTYWSALRILDTGRSDLPIRYDGNSVVTACLVLFYVVAIPLIRSMNGHDRDEGGATPENDPGFRGGPLFTFMCVLVASLGFPNILMWFWYRLEIPIYGCASGILQCDTAYLMECLKAGGNANGPMMLALAFCAPVLVTRPFKYSTDAVIFWFWVHDAHLCTSWISKGVHQFWTESPNFSPRSLSGLDKVFVCRVLCHCCQVVVSLWTSRFTREMGFGDLGLSSMIDLVCLGLRTLAFGLSLVAVVILFMGGLHWAYFRLAYLGNVLFKAGSEQSGRGEFSPCHMGILSLIIWTAALYQIATV